MKKRLKNFWETYLSSSIGSHDKADPSWSEATDALPAHVFGRSAQLDAVNELLTQQPSESRAAWLAFFHHCLREAAKNAPTTKWLGAAENTLQRVPGALQAALLSHLFRQTASFILEKHQAPLSAFSFERTAGVPAWLSPACWYAGRYLSAFPDVLSSLNDLTDAGYKKMPGVGPLAVKTANACLHAFAQMPDNRGIMSIIRQQKRAVNGTIRHAIDKILQELSVKSGLSPGELKERSIPDFQLDSQRRVQCAFGEYSAILLIDPAGQVSTQWQHVGTGKPIKSAPTSVKKDQAQAFKAFQQQQKELKEALSSVAYSLESAWLERRVWTLDQLQHRLLQHPVMSAVAGRLIWQFEQGEKQGEAIFHQGRWQHPGGEAPAWLQPDSLVRLWHPISRPASAVLQWRHWLEKEQILQPFKQAFREVYVVTPPEIHTSTYSNRFAAHILRQHQFAALCHLRGWHYRLQGAFYTPDASAYREAPAWQYRVEYWVDTADFNEMTDAGIYQYIFTDQVRFSHRGVQMEVQQVPPLLFSELMRDVDLFVGVCSIGNDPNWQDSGDGRLRQYWEDYAFADALSASGEVRLETLKRIIPRLKIGPKCRFEGKYLLVQGTFHTYKIHCGSGNILMSPNDQYLCIVPDRGGATQSKHPVFLPFEGDSMLSVVISKAMMLAEDEKIKDPSILRQL